MTLKAPLLSEVSHDLEAALPVLDHGRSFILIANLLGALSSDGITGWWLTATHLNGERLLKSNGRLRNDSIS